MSATDLTGATFSIVSEYQVGSNNPTVTNNLGNQTAPATVPVYPGSQAIIGSGNPVFTLTGNQITENLMEMSIFILIQWEGPHFHSTVTSSTLEAERQQSQALHLLTPMQ